MKLIQIVPRFEPLICGVGDQARILGEGLARDHGIHSRFAISSPAWIPAAKRDGAPEAFSLTPNARQAASGLAERAADAAGVLVHFSGYGYAKRGAPVWLPMALKRFRRRHPGVPIHTMFHELATRGPWRSSSFWNWPVQRWIVAELIRLSDGSVFTNREEYGRQIRQLAGSLERRCTVMPVFSNFGEAGPVADREPSLAWFGWQIPPGTSALFYQRMETMIRSFGIRSVQVLRHPLPEGGRLSVPVKEHGILPADEISAVLSRCRYAFVDYNPLYLGKSSLLAAYAAHQMIVILQTGTGALPDGIEVGRHVLSLDDPGSFGDAASQAGTAGALHDWYRGHNRAATAAAFAGAIRESWDRRHTAGTAS